jgi:hypothetical protein
MTGDPGRDSFSAAVGVSLRGVPVSLGLEVDGGMGGILGPGEVIRLLPLGEAG